MTRAVLSSSAAVVAAAAAVAAAPCSVVAEWATQSAPDETPCVHSALAMAVASTRALWAEAGALVPPMSHRYPADRCWSRAVFDSWVSKRLLRRGSGTERIFAFQCAWVAHNDTKGGTGDR